MTDMPPFPPTPGVASGPSNLPSKTSGLALAAMILGISSLIIPIVITAILGVILGIVALTQIGRSNTYGQTLTGRGFAIVGIVTGALGVTVIPIFALLIAILLPSLGRARELSNRTYCAANARGIMQSMNVYGADNNDQFPLLPYAPYGPGNNGASTVTAAGATADDALKSIYASAPPPQAGSPLASTWILVFKNAVTPKQFICKSDPFAGTVAAQLQPAGSSDFYINFQTGNQISYSFAYPYNTKGEIGNQWKATTDSSLPIMSDMAPLNGTGSPIHNVSPGTPYPNPRSWNSGNHANEGQIVGYSDGHANFERRPDIGQNNDNIYSFSGTNSISQYGGTQPTDSPIEIQTDAAPFDIYMVPARNLTSGALNK